VPDLAHVQRRTLRLLFGTQISGGIGTTIGISVGGLLAARLGGTTVSGFAQSCATIGAALLAVPVSRLMSRHGRRPGLVLAYALGMAGATLIVLAAAERQVALLFAGMLAFGGGSAANLQARYSAVDLSSPDRRARQLSLIVWATTLGSVLAPNLANPADALVRRLGAPALTGPFFVSLCAFGLAATVIGLFLRPDPLLTARRLVLPANAAGIRRTGRGEIRAAWRAVITNPSARLAVGAVATGHMVMVGVMAMTPVHIGMAGMAGDGDVLRIVGLVLSVHVAGMYALAPLVGYAADRLGRRTVILAGLTTQIAACAVAGTSGTSTARLMIGLALLGFGWSAMIVAGSALLTESIEVSLRPSAQGLSDLIMGIGGALGGALSGVVVSGAGYPTLTLIAAIATVPLLALALRTDAGRVSPGVSSDSPGVSSDSSGVSSGARGSGTSESEVSGVAVSEA
jgi:MFS family permease